MKKVMLLAAAIMVLGCVGASAQTAAPTAQTPAPTAEPAKAPAAQPKKPLPPEQQKLIGAERTKFIQESTEACVKGSAESGATPVSQTAYCRCNAQRTAARLTRAQLAGSVDPIKPQMDAIKTSCQGLLKAVKPAAAKKP